MCGAGFARTVRPCGPFAGASQRSTLLSSLMQQLPTLIGVVVGALCSYVVHATSERARWRRTREERWDTPRMEAYVRYGNAIKATTMIATRLAAERGYIPVVERISIDEGLADLAKAQLNRALLWEEVQLLGHPDTVRAARKWHESSWRMDEAVRHTEYEPMQWNQAAAAAVAARATFYEAARRDLSIRGDLPQSSWPRDPLLGSPHGPSTDSQLPA